MNRRSFLAAIFQAAVAVSSLAYATPRRPDEIQPPTIDTPDDDLIFVARDGRKLATLELQPSGDYLGYADHTGQATTVIMGDIITAVDDLQMNTTIIAAGDKVTVVTRTVVAR